MEIKKAPRRAGLKCSTRKGECDNDYYKKRI